MKRLYTILRLFFCPHKWDYIKGITVVNEEDQAIGHKQVCKCRRCGKFKAFYL